jgi:lipoyl(octanoyl) transferase
VEHPHVLTLGKSGDPGNVVVSQERLEALGVEYFPINRGGDITYHGPGQLVGYPILDLDQFYTDIGKYMRMLEEAIIRTCADYGLEASRIEGLTGVWVDAGQGLKARKIAALGVKCSRWVTMHGFAFNLNTDLDFFNLIVPCGINDRGVTSLAKESGRAIDEAEAANRLKTHLTDLFDWNLIFADQNR